MTTPRILVFAGSIRSGSFNARLAALAAKELALAEAEVTLISLGDYALPIYDGDLEQASGPPATAINLKRLMCRQHGVFIASPEINASISPLLKNAIDWVSRVRERNEPPHVAFKGRAFALGAASRDVHGGTHSLLALRQVLAVGCGALVLPEQVSLPEAHHAFDDRMNLKDERAAAQLKLAAQRLVEMASVIAR